LKFFATIVKNKKKNISVIKIGKIIWNKLDENTKPVNKFIKKLGKKINLTKITVLKGFNL
jgi:2-polyprenyl-3-methyl-5-hydroxy-6-metoxy-1,4-benzoquinol methylase